MQADDFSFAEGDDLETFVGTAAFADQPLEGDRGAGRGVFFVDVVALEDLAGVAVAQGSGGCLGYIEEKIHTDGKIRSVDESGLVQFDQMANAIDFTVPASRSYDHVYAGYRAGFNVGDHAMGRSEVEDCIDPTKFLGIERGAGVVLFGSGDFDVMFALGSHVGDQRASLSTSQEK